MGKLLKKVRRVLRNVVLDLRFGSFLGGTIKTRFSYLGAYDVANSDYLSLRYLFKDRLRIGQDDVLVDVGCGKGRVINYWLHLGLKNEIVAVELDGDIAKKTSRRLRLYSNVRVVNANILEYIPDNGTIFYMFNPFDERVMEEFKSALFRIFWDRRKITLVYRNAKHVSCFRDDPNWKLELFWIPGEADLSAIITLEAR